MAYIFQTVSVNQVLTAAIYNQTENNIRDHVHGISGVSASPVRVLDRVTATATVTNTTTETDSYTFTVVGGTLGTTGLIYFKCIGSYLNNSGGNSTLTLRLYYGGTAHSALSLTLAPSGSERVVIVEGWIYAKGATNSQDVAGRAMFSSPTGVGGTGNAVDTHVSLFALATIDSAANQIFKLTAMHSVAAATITWSRRNCQLQLHAVAA